MSERDPFEQSLRDLGDLIDEPVEPRPAFADHLRSRLMSDLSASQVSREEHETSMDGAIELRPMPRIALERPRHIRPMAILELAAATIIIVGLAAAIGRGGWFGNGPETPTGVPAAALQGDGTPTPEQEPESTPTPEPTVVPPGGLEGSIWSLPLTDGESLEFGGMLVEDGVVYRLLKTSSFAGIEAVDGESGAVIWTSELPWSGSFFAIEDDLIFYNSEPNVLSAVSAETGESRWSAELLGNPIQIETEDDLVLALLDTNVVAAVSQSDGTLNWTLPIGDSATEASQESSGPTGGRLETTDQIVAAVSTEGVITGFDLASGEKRWSHDGYDGATTYLQEEDDVIVVTSGGPAFAGGAGAGFGAGVQSGGTMEESVPAGNVSVEATPGEAGGMSTGGAAGASAEAGQQGGGMTAGAVAGQAGAVSCVTAFAPAGVEAGASGSNAGTVATAGMVGVTTAGSVGIQGIDPETGDILWGQQSLSASNGQAPDATLIEAGSVASCAVDVTNGAIVTLPAPGASAPPEAGVSASDDGQVVVGAVTDGGFVVSQAGIASVAVADSAASANGEFISIASDESGVYGTMADGTLVKIAPGSAGDDDQHQNDASDSSPESDNDD